MGGDRSVVRALCERRRGRSTRTQARHDQEWGVPRSARRQGCGARLDVRARRAWDVQRALRVVRGYHRGPRDRHQPVSRVRRSQGCEHARKSYRQDQDTQPAGCGRFRGVAVDGDRCADHLEGVAVDRRRPHDPVGCAVRHSCGDQQGRLTCAATS